MSDSTTGTEPVNELRAPGLWRRMACWMYEGMLLFGVVFITGYLFSTLSQTRHALDNRHVQQALLVCGHLLVVFGHHHPLALALRGQFSPHALQRGQGLALLGAEVFPSRLARCWRCNDRGGVGRC